MAVQRQPDTLARRVAQGEKRRLRSARDATVGRDKLHRAAKLLDRDMRIVLRYFLVGRIAHRVTREPVPIAHAVAAKTTLAVVDQQRCWAHGQSFGETLADCNAVASQARMTAVTLQARNLAMSKKRKPASSSSSASITPTTAVPETRKDRLRALLGDVVAGVLFGPFFKLMAAFVL